LLDWLLKLIGGKDEIDIAEDRMKEDAKDPLHVRVHGLLLISEPADPGHRPDFANQAVREWYGCADRAAVLQKIEMFAASADGYDVFRATFLARAAAGAGLISPEESWSLCQRTLATAQRNFATWQDYGDAYIRGHLWYRRTQGDDEATLAGYEQNLRKTMAELQAKSVWSRVPLLG
jgi:hypothetical protein